MEYFVCVFSMSLRWDIRVLLCLIYVMCFWYTCVHNLFVLLECFLFGISHILWYSNSVDSVVNSTTTGTTTWPGTVVNQADSLGFNRCILSSTVQGESGTGCHPVVCDSIIFDRCVSKVFCLCFLIVFEMGYLSVIVLDISRVLPVYMCT